MKTLCASAISASAMVLGLIASGSVSAQSTYWHLYSGSSNTSQGIVSGCSQNALNSGSFNNSYNCTVGTGQNQESATVSAWSANTDRGAAAGVLGTVNKDSPYTRTNLMYGAEYALTGSGFASALISNQGNSGFGGTSRFEAQTARAGGDSTPLAPASPNHSFDSVAPGSYDLMLLDFGLNSLVLDKIGIGWKGTDSDLTLMRWTGATSPTGVAGSSTMNGDGHGNLLSTLYNPASPSTAGWELVSSYSNLGTDAGSPFGGSARSTGATQASSWWLISAFNTALNGGSTSCLKADETTTTCSAGNDSIKLNFIATSPALATGVPEPSSLALAGVALTGLFGARRRIGKRA